MFAVNICSFPFTLQGKSPVALKEVFSVIYRSAYPGTSLDIDALRFEQLTALSAVFWFEGFSAFPATALVPRIVAFGIAKLLLACRYKFPAAVLADYQSSSVSICLLFQGSNDCACGFP